MVELSQIATDLLIGRKYYSDQLALQTIDIENGCNDCRTDFMYLQGIIMYLESDIASEINNDDTQAIYKLLLIETRNNIGSAATNPNVVIPGITIIVQGGGNADLDFSFNHQLTADGLTSVFLIPHGYQVSGENSVPPSFDVEGLNENAQDGQFTITADDTNLILTYTGVFPYGLCKYFCTRTPEQ